MSQKTLEDTSAGRASGLHHWLSEVNKEFLEAYERSRSDPARTLEVLRRALEAWAYATRIHFDPGWKSHERGDPHTEELGKTLTALKSLVPAWQFDLAKSLKSACDKHHHVSVEPTGSASHHGARARLTEMAGLVEALYAEQRLPLPGQAARAIEDLMGRRPAAVISPTWVGEAPPPMLSPPRTTRSGAMRGVLIAAFIAAAIGAAAGLVLIAKMVVDERPMDDASSDADSPKKDSQTRATQAASDTQVGTTGAAKSKLDEETHALVSAYESAINSRNVSRVMARIEFPMKRYFLKTDVSSETVTRLVEIWFTPENFKTTHLESCGPASVGPEGQRSVQCVERLDSREKPEDNCLVFARDGRLTARFKVTDAEPCRPL